MATHITDGAAAHYSWYAKNVYVDLDGTIKPKNLPASGLWRFDGQIFFKPDWSKF